VGKGICHQAWWHDFHTPQMQMELTHTSCPQTCSCVAHTLNNKCNIFLKKAFPPQFMQFKCRVLPVYSSSQHQLSRFLSSRWVTDLPFVCAKGQTWGLTSTTSASLPPPSLLDSSHWFPCTPGTHHLKVTVFLRFKLKEEMHMSWKPLQNLTTALTVLVW